ncbi:MAG: efflux RND transporter periplasmic adaptor subunit [bacterium]
MKKILKEPKHIISLVGAVAVVVVIIVFVTTSTKPQSQFAIVKHQDITESVKASGEVKAATSIDLAFVRGGRISSAPVSAGDSVYAGQLLASIESADIQAQYEQADAAYKTQQAKLDSLTAGTRPETLSIDQASLSGAAANLSGSENAVLAAIQNAYNQSDDAVRVKADAIILNGRTSNPRLNITLSDQSLVDKIQNDRVQMDLVLQSWQNDIGNISLDAGTDSLNNAVTEAENAIQKISGFMSEIGSAANSLNTSNNPALSSTAISAIQANISLGRSGVSGAQSALISSFNQEQSAVTTYLKSKDQLALDQNGPTQNDINAQKAQVEAALANRNLFAAQLGQTVIRAPIDGIVTKQNAHVGEIASPGVPIVSMNSSSKFQIEIYLSEADIAKVKIGDTAVVTLDAYQNSSSFDTTVVSVDPAATIQNGISDYKTVLEFKTDDSRIKAGMTANAVISAGSSTSALIVPSSAIITEGSDTYVLKSNGKTNDLTKVQVGITDANGNTQIVSGLQDGDKVAAFGISSIK